MGWKTKEQANKYQNERRNRFKALGLCVVCEKKKAKVGNVCCERCLIQKRLHMMKNRETKPEDIKRMLKDQGGRCAICKKHLKKYYIDHNHKTNKVRGILCSSCNVGIALFKEEKRILFEAVKYIEKHK